MNVLEEDDNTAFCHLKKERFSSIYVMLCQSLLDFDEVQKGNAVNLICGEHYCGCLLVAAKKQGACSGAAIDASRKYNLNLVIR